MVDFPAAHAALPGALTTPEIDATRTYVEGGKAGHHPRRLHLGLARSRRPVPLPAAPPQLPTHQGLVADYFST